MCDLTTTLCAADMELGHISWPSDPVTRESSDPETQLIWWPCSIMNSKCRVMLQTNVCNGQQVCQFYSLFGVCTLLGSKILKIISMTVGRIFTKIYIFISLSWAFFRKPEKLGSHTRSEWWPGDPVTRWPERERWPTWPIDPMTQWPSSMSGVAYLAWSQCSEIHCRAATPLYDKFLRAHTETIHTHLWINHPTFVCTSGSTITFEALRSTGGFKGTKGAMAPQTWPPTSSRRGHLAPLEYKKTF